MLSTARGEIETQALVTERLRPFEIDGRRVYQIGMPWHFGWEGYATGDIANVLTAVVGDPNTTHPRGQGVHLQPAQGPAAHGRRRRQPRMTVSTPRALRLHRLDPRPA